jgi:aconitate hydratase 2/2-methylisocitrate dehydratase
LIDAAAAVKLLGNMHGGYNVATLVNLLDDDALAESAAEELKGTILVFDAFHDVAGKSRCGQRPRQGCDAILGRC